MWGIGDLAICIHGGSDHYMDVCECGSEVCQGHIYTIEDIITDRDDLWDEDEMGFILEGMGCPDCYYPSQDFRKINPLTEEEKDEFLNEIRVPELC